MSRNQEPPYPSNRPGRQPSQARDDHSGYDDDDDPYGDDEGGDDENRENREHRPSKLPNREDDEEIAIDPDVDIIQVLDEDDLRQMDGPDA